MPLVTSSNLHSINYVNGNLHAVFNANLNVAYKYYEIPFSIYETILKSESVGKAFDALILKANPTYKFSRIVGVNHETGVLQEIVRSEPFEEFQDVISFLVSKGLARKENDEAGELRVVFSGEYLKEMEGYFKRQK